jgi:fibronectin-binding autotransporter adhesin
MHTPLLGAKNELRARKLSRRFIWVAAVIAACLCPTLAFGQTNSTYIGGMGAWDNASDWTPNQVPNNGGGNTYAVTIDSGGSDYLAVGNATINSLVLGGTSSGHSTLVDASGELTTLNVLGGFTLNNNGELDFYNGNNLTVGGNTLINGYLSVPGTLSVAGTMTVGASGYFNLGVTGSAGIGTLVNQGEGYLGVGSVCTSCVIDVGTLVNQGSLDVTNTVNLTNQPNGITDVPKGSVLFIGLGGRITAGSSNALSSLATIEGTLNLLNGQPLTLVPTILSNTGSLDLAEGSSLTVTNLINSGSVSVGGKTTGTGTLSVTGAFTNNAGATLTIADSSTVSLEGVITNKGTIDVVSVSHNTFLDIGANTTLGASGKVILSDCPDFCSNGPYAYLEGSGTLTNQGTIEGTGNIGNGQIGLVNTGTIYAEQGTLIIDTNGTGFSNSSGTKNGTLRSTGLLDILGPFNNFSGGTLTGGTYQITGELEFAAGATGIVTNDSSITLYRSSAEIYNTSNGTNALSGFAENGGTFTWLGTTTYTDANVFTNSGTIAVGKGGTFYASTQLTNFNSTNGTLTGGSYTLTATGQIQFNNGGFTNNIVTNDAKITLAGVDTTKNPFIDQSGGNALQNFATNGASGSLYLTTDRVFTNTGSLTNAGIVDVEISTGTGKTELIIGGAGVYTQTGGATTVDGVLSAPGGINISGGFVYGNALTKTGTEGTLIGAVDLTGGTLNPGNAVKLLGTIDITGTFAESGAGVLNIDLDGTVAGTKYDVLNVSGAAALGGTIDFVLNAAFKPVVGDAWDVLNYTSETGSFTTVNLPTAPTGDHYVFACGVTDCTLTLDSGPAAAVKGAVSGAAATRVTGGSMPGDSSGSTHEPLAILSRVTCYGARLLGLTSCGTESIGSRAVRAEHQLAPVSAASGMVHNNVLVASRSISAGRAGASHTPSASTTAMARLYVCAYLPSSVAHTMGCN